MKKLMISAALLAAMSAPALAEQPSYNYVGLGYFQGGESGLDYDGFQIDGSVAFDEDWFGVASYGTADIDGFDGDFSLFSVGVGYTQPMSATSSWYASASLVRAEIDTNFGSIDDTGYGLEAGIRDRSMGDIELGASLGYIDVFDDTDTALSGYAMYHINEQFALIVDLSTADTYDFGFGARFHF